MIGPAERARILGLARAAVEATARGEPLPAPPGDGLFREPRACFVSLHDRGGALRGCLGMLQAREPLGRAVVEMAAAAASRDPRFGPVEPDELADLEVEVSVLTPFEDTRPEAVEPGRDGLWVERAGRSGLLLPQVAEKYGWDREEFLSQTCLKAGLDQDAWRRPGTRIRRFQAEVFGEAPAST